MSKIAGWLIIRLIGFVLSASLAVAQENFPTPGGSRVPGHVSMCLNAQGNAVATDQSGACPGGGGGSTTITSPLVSSGADGVSNTLDGVSTYARMECWNSATWDRCQAYTAGTQDTPSTQTLTSVPVPSAAAAAGVVPVTSGALAANQIIKASAGNLYSFEVSADSTLSGAAWWLMIYDAVSAPVDGAVTPKKCYAMPSGTTSYSGAFPTPIVFATGITIGVSTTGCFTKTASTHAFISGDFR